MLYEVLIYEVLLCEVLLYEAKLSSSSTQAVVPLQVAEALFLSKGVVENFIYLCTYLFIYVFIYPLFLALASRIYTRARAIL